ncbi:DoxX family protein [Vibrio penaeicida]|uniref:DoxX family protein n=1 Tax=Vibrio penaeicida TaxID=104609 RepID=A0AAV5NUY0_9VIBR|nr:DoxX family protein [Vibrio penaeicida]RTZ22783.1 DoxX family protein [Vibrio penaeicida]GLQ74268.1 hypothetical protein GCM10007932_36290 [Vibrio penaeicida]
MTVIISVILVVFFTFASSIKILGWQKKVFETQLAFFVKYGLNRAVMFLTGLVELAGSGLLAASWFYVESWILLSGAGLLAITSVGAIFFHLRFDRWQDGVPATITLILSSVLFIL